MNQPKQVLNLPSTVVFDNQPYGPVVLGELRLGSYNGYPTVTGVVLEGTETSRLGAHRLTKSVVGQHRTVYGVEQWELDKGRITRAYCG